MKVLQINSVCGYGSTGRIAVDLYHTLKQNGHDSMIAYGRGSSPEDVSAIRIGSDWDVMVHGVMSRLTDKHGFYSKRATKELICKIKDYDPDIVHLHNLHGYYLNIEELFHYLAESNKPVIWTLHDCWAFTGHCAYFDFVNCDKWRTQCCNCPQMREYPDSLFVDQSEWNYKKKKEIFTSVKNMTIVTPSTWLANLVKKSFLSSFPVRVINNGIDLDVFKPTPSDFREKYHLESKYIILGVASVWEQRKGLSYLLDLAHNLNCSFQVVIVGLSKKQMKQLPSNVLGIERTNSVQQLVEVYTAADVFVNPTLEDNFPTTNLEALACGTPVITFDTGGSPECIKDTCGIVTEKGKIKSLIHAVECFEHHSVLSTNCLNIAENYGKNKIFKKYLDIYCEVLE